MRLATDVTICDETYSHIQRQSYQTRIHWKSERAGDAGFVKSHGIIKYMQKLCKNNKLRWFQRFQVIIIGPKSGIEINDKLFIKKV